MKYGFIKAAVGSPSIRVADCGYNREQIALLMRQASGQSVRLLVLPELCLTGYTCGDLFLQSTLLRGAEEGLRGLLEDSRGLDLLTAVGLPLIWEGSLYNCAAVLLNGELLGVVPKAFPPNYGEFYELRHFSPAPSGNGEITAAGRSCPFGTDLLFQCGDMADFTLAVEICEDLWVPSPPSVRHGAAGATLIANLSASDETVGKAEYRRELVKGQSSRLICGYLYADAGEGESTTDLVFAGHNFICEAGTVLAETPPFGKGLAVSELDVERLARERRRMTSFASASVSAPHQKIYFSIPLEGTVLTRAVPRLPFVPENPEERARRCASILEIQAAGLKKRLEHTRCRTAVLGISGGLDSTLALLAAVRAMDALNRPRADILAVTMPCFGTTGRTRSNAEALCGRLGVSFREVSIAASVTRHFEDIGQDAGKHDVTYENSQARERTQVLMDIANQTEGLVIGTGDLSELALGWATYNGDHMSMYGVNASIPKTLVRHLVQAEADAASDPALREVLLDILDTPVSPELLPPEKDGTIAQKTEELVGPYELHDFFLYYFLRWGFSPAKILYLAEYAFRGEYHRAEILKWLRLFCRRFFSQQFKRSCLPDGPKVGSVGLSPRGDWRMPSDASCALWMEELDRLE